MKKLYTLVAIALVAMVATPRLSAQTVNFGGTALNNDIITWGDIYNLSNTAHNYGTARSMAMGNAFTALGADMISASLNPAGVGMYVESDISLSPMMQFTKSPTRGGEPYYNGVPRREQKFKDNTSRFGMSSVGGIFTAYRGTGAVTNVNVGFAYNRIADFNQSYRNASLGNSAINSMANIFCSMSNLDGLQTDADGRMDFGNDPYYWGSVLAYKNGLTNKDDQGWFIDRISPDAEIDQYSAVETRGSIGEYAITFGMNFVDKFYIGASLGIQSINYRRTTFYGENYIYADGLYPSGEEMPYQLDYMNYSQATELSGTGVNFKIGATYRPFKFLRLGIAYHTPTAYSVAFGYAAEMWSRTYSAGSNPDGYEYDKDGYFYDNVESPEWVDNGQYSWNFRSPHRLMFGAAFTIFNRIILSADYERSWYQSARLQSSPIYGLSYTSQLNEYFKGGNTVRLGAELNLLPLIVVRAGYIWSGNNFRNGYENQLFSHPLTKEQHYVTAGLGWRFGSTVYLDLAYQYGITERTNYKTFYAVETSDTHSFDPIESIAYNTKTERHHAVLTLGFRF